MLKKIIIIIGFLTILFAVNIYRLNRSPVFMTEQHFAVRHGQTLRNIAMQLKRDNLIRSEQFFLITASVIGRKYIKAGEYKISKGLSALAILLKMTRGDILTKKVTIPEGYNLYQIATRLEKNAITDEDKFLYYVFNRDFLRSINIHATSAEGYLFPDTYVLPQASDARDIIVIMHNKLQDVLQNLSKDHEKIETFNIHKLLTLASLIEKEARIAHERKYIASVFYNRLQSAMRLDCDPTVRYAVKKFRGRITYNDLAHDSPYNTYIRKGLPPTPISSISKASLLAAINPAETRFLYFVARQDGSHYFSKTLKEHNRAVNYYIKGKREGFTDNQNLQ